MKKYITIEKAVHGEGLKINVYNGNYFQAFFITGDMLDMTKYPVYFDLSELFKPVRKIIQTCPKRQKTKKSSLLKLN